MVTLIGTPAEGDCPRDMIPGFDHGIEIVVEQGHGRMNAYKGLIEILEDRQPQDCVWVDLGKAKTIRSHQCLEEGRHRRNEPCQNEALGDADMSGVRSVGRSSAWCRTVAPCSFCAVDTTSRRSTIIFLLQPGTKKGSEVLNSSQECSRAKASPLAFHGQIGRAHV